MAGDGFYLIRSKNCIHLIIETCRNNVRQMAGFSDCTGALMLAKRICTLLFLGLYLSGCSSYQQGALPNTAPSNSEFEADVQVSQGSNVRVTLESGEVIEGEVILVSDREISVSQLTDGEAHIRVVTVSDISSLEVEQSSSTTTIVFASIIGAALVYATVEGIKGWSLW
jgi:hypothetical protein